MIKSTYRTLVAWQRGIELATDLYEVSRRFPEDDRFAITQQLRRAALSVPSNIAEGRGRGTSRDYRRFLLQARGSLYEIETICELATRIGYLSVVDASQLQRKIQDVVRPLNGLIKSLPTTPLAARRSPLA
jgi:four helix bundle protein